MYIGNLSKYASNTIPDLPFYIMLCKEAKYATVTDLREMDRILKKVEEKDNKMIF